MTYLSNTLGISAGEETELREITAPKRGETYIESYHQVLAAIETNSIHIADTQSTLPAADTYPNLVGIAASTHEDIDGKTLHVADGDEWVDTYTLIDDALSELSNSETIPLDEYDEYDSLEDVAAAVDATSAAIAQLESDIGGGTGFRELQRKFEEIKDCLEPATFEIDQPSAPSAVAAGELVTVTADITNTGHKTGTQRVTLERKADGSELDSQRVDGLCGTVGVVNGSVVNGTPNTESVSLSWEPTKDDTGSTTLVVRTDDDAVELEVTVESAIFEIEDLELSWSTWPSEDPEARDSVHATATIKNTGNIAGTAAYVHLYRNGELEKDEPRDASTTSYDELGPGELEPGDEEYVMLTWNSAARDDHVGYQELTLKTPDDSKTDDIYMNDPGFRQYY